MENIEKIENGLIQYNAGNVYFFEINRELPLQKRIELIHSLKSTGGICKNENNRFYWYYPNFDKSKIEKSKFTNFVHVDHLFEYQRTDLDRTIHMNRCLLTYDTGLGKTILSIATLINLHKQKNTQNLSSLIIVPKALIKQWQEEIAKYTNNELSIHIIDGSSRKNTQPDITKNINLLTYARLRKISNIEQYRFFYVVFDEANNVKNISSKQTKAACLINSEYKLLLTATPIKNNPTEIYSLFKVLDMSKYLFNKYNDFLNDFAIRQFNQTTNTYFTVGYKNLKKLSKIISPFCIHREKTEDIKKQIGLKLELLEQYRYLERSVEQKHCQKIIDARIFDERHMFSDEYYRKILENLNERGIKENNISAISLFTLSRLLSDSSEVLLRSNSETVNKIFNNYVVENEKNPKLVEVQNILEELNQKTIIFTCFSTVAEMINNFLFNNGYETYITTGKTSNNEEIIESFKNSPKRNAILVSTDVSKYGLNLQFCSNIIHFDLPFTYSELKQRNGRIDRIGQQNIPNVFYLIVKDTVDENMVEFIRQKKIYKDIMTTPQQPQLQQVEKIRNTLPIPIKYIKV